MSKPLISSMRLSYKIGFSSALNPDTISGYAEIARYDFPAGTNAVRLRRAFFKGYLHATKILREVRYELNTNQNHT